MKSPKAVKKAEAKSEKLNTRTSEYGVKVMGIRQSWNQAKNKTTLNVG